MLILEKMIGILNDRSIPKYKKLFVYPYSVLPRRNKNTPRLQKLKVEPKTEPIKIKEKMKDELVAVVKVDHSVTTG